MNKYAHAIIELQRALEISENNAPIFEAEGSVETAQVCRQHAESFREAIALLEKEGKEPLVGRWRPLTQEEQKLQPIHDAVERGEIKLPSVTLYRDDAGTLWWRLRHSIRALYPPQMTT